MPENVLFGIQVYGKPTSLGFQSVPEAEAMAQGFIAQGMPVILEREDYEAWLLAANTAIPRAMLRPCPSQLMQAHPVSKRGKTPRTITPI